MCHSFMNTSQSTAGALRVHERKSTCSRPQTRISTRAHTDQLKSSDTYPATSLDTDEKEFHQNILNVFLDIVKSYHLGERLLDWGRNWACGTELPFCIGPPLGEHLLIFFAASLHSAGQHASFSPEMNLCARDCLLGAHGFFQPPFRPRGRPHAAHAHRAYTRRRCQFIGHVWTDFLSRWSSSSSSSLLLAFISCAARRLPAHLVSFWALFKRHTNRPSWSLRQPSIRSLPVIRPCIPYVFSLLVVVVGVVNPATCLNSKIPQTPATPVITMIPMILMIIAILVTPIFAHSAAFSSISATLVIHAISAISRISVSCA